MSDMTLGQRLREYLDRSKQQQQTVAMTWLDRWSKSGGEDKAHTTVTSRLNDLLADRSKGVRFFFDDLKGSSLLLDLLDVPKEQRKELMTMAEAARAQDGRTPARLVIDATSLAGANGREEGLFASVREKLLGEAKLLPAVLVMTEGQHNVFPRRVEKEFGDRLVLRPVATGEDVAEVVRDLLTEHALLASSRAQAPYSRWLALHFDGQALQLEPPDGVAAFAQRGELPGLPVVRHDLAALGITASGSLPEQDACARRRLMADLGEESFRVTVRNPPETRLAWAQQLGVRAASTERERVEAEVRDLVAQLGLPVETVNQQQFDTALERARRRPVSDAALRVGDMVHVINPSHKPARRHPRLTVHRITCAEPALGRLLTAIDGWTVDDYLDDRRLDRVIGRLDPEGKERNVFLHARAWLLHTGALAPLRAGASRDWQTGLTAILEEDVPPASFRLRLEDNLTWSGGGRQQKPPFLLDSKEAKRAQAAKPSLLFQVPAIGDMTIGRQDSAVVICREDVARVVKYPEVLIPRSPDLARSIDAWLDAVDHSPALGGQPVIPFTDERGYLPHSDGLDRWNSVPVVIPSDLWREADWTLAEIWLALKWSIHKSAVRMHDGTVFVGLAPGFAAAVRLCPHGSADDAPHASFLLPLAPAPEDRPARYQPTSGGYQAFVPSRTELVQSGGPGYMTPVATAMGGRLPRALRLSGRGYVANLSFRPTLLLGGGGLAESALRAAGGAAASVAGQLHELEMRE